MLSCIICHRNFINQNGLDGHLSSPRHARRACRCKKCNLNFPNLEAREQHQASQHPALTIRSKCTQFRRCDCNRDFVHQTALLSHLKDKKNHSTSRQVSTPKQTVCELCGKQFKTTIALKAHKASIRHKPICATFPCVGSPQCKRKFNLPSSMLDHLESGACISGLTRDQINTMVASQDSNGLIMSPELLESAESSLGDSWIMTPSSGLSMLDEDESWSMSSGIMTPLSDDSQSVMVTTLFLCPLCPPKSNRFRTKDDLEKHSNSPTHQPKIFHCPTALFGEETVKGRPMKMFSTLSGLTKHIESGACGQGRKTFQKVMSFVNDRLRGLGFKEILLLK